MSDYGNDIYATSEGTIYLLAMISSDTIFGKGEANETCLNYGTIIVQYNSDGTFNWAKRAIDGFASSDFDISNTGDIVLTGMSSYTFIDTWGPGDPNQTDLSLNPSCDCGLTECADIAMGMFSP